MGHPSKVFLHVSGFGGEPPGYKKNGARRQAQGARDKIVDKIT
jgi:hypothetical protein